MVKRPIFYWEIQRIGIWGVIVLVTSWIKKLIHDFVNDDETINQLIL